MSEPLKGVIVSHGGLCEALIEAVRGITGEAGGLVAVTNADCSREALLERLSGAVGQGPSVVFVDMPAGSCLQAAVAGIRSRPDVPVVSGVNLPMLLDFVYHRDLSPAEAADRAAAAGERSIQTIKS